MTTAQGASAQGASAQAMTDAQLVAEMMRRHILPQCPCGKHPTYISPCDYERDGSTYRCAGCLHTIGNCTC